MKPGTVCYVVELTLTPKHLCGCGRTHNAAFRRHPQPISDPDPGIQDQNLKRLPERIPA